MVAFRSQARLLRLNQAILEGLLPGCWLQTRSEHRFQGRVVSEISRRVQEALQCASVRA